MAGDRNCVHSPLATDSSSNSKLSPPPASFPSSTSSSSSLGIRCPLCKRWIHLLEPEEESSNVWLLLGHLSRSHPACYERIRQRPLDSVQAALQAAQEAQTAEADSSAAAASVTPVSDAIAALLQQAPPLSPPPSPPPPSLLPSVLPFSRSLPSIVGGSGDPLQRYSLINDALRELFDFSQLRKDEKQEAAADEQRAMQQTRSAVDEKEEKAEKLEPLVKQEAEAASRSAALLASAEHRDYRKRKLEYGSMREAVQAEMAELQTRMRLLDSAGELLPTHPAAATALSSLAASGALPPDASAFASPLTLPPPLPPRPPAAVIDTVYQSNLVRRGFSAEHAAAYARYHQHVLSLQATERWIADRQKADREEDERQKQRWRETGGDGVKARGSMEWTELRTETADRLRNHRLTRL